MTRDELEFSVSQYLDGTLPADERVALEARLAGDAEARAVLAEYRQLDAGLKAIPDIDPLPGIHWDRLADQISATIAAHDDARAEEQAATYRIGAGSRRWRTWLGGLAVAASALVAGIVGWRVMKSHTPGTTPGGNPVATRIEIHNDPLPPTPVTEIALKGVSEPDADAAAVAVNAQPVVVSIGAEPGDAGVPFPTRYAGVVSRPSRVTIASALSPVQDAPAAPF